MQNTFPTSGTKKISIDYFKSKQQCWCHAVSRLAVKIYYGYSIKHNMDSVCKLQVVHLLTPAGEALWSTSWYAGSNASVRESGIIDPRKLPDLLLLQREWKYDHIT